MTIKILPLIFANLLPVTLVWAAIPSSTETLKKGYLPFLEYWEERLEKSNPFQANLYRLAWMQRGLSPAGAKSQPNELSWAWEGEIWIDEKPISDESRSNTLGLDRLDPRILAQWYRSMDSYWDHPIEVRQGLRKAWFFRYQILGQQDLQPPKLLPNLKVINQESCEIEFMSFLAQARPMAGWEKCLKFQSEILQTGQLTMADRFFHKGEWSKAELLYRSVIEGLGSVPDELWYRHAVLADFGRRPLDQVIRSALRVSRSQGLPKKLVSIGYEILCEQFKGRPRIKELRKVFPARAYLATLLGLSQSCIQKYLPTHREKRDHYRFLLGLKSEVKGRGEELKWTFQLLELSLATEGLDPQPHFRAMARISRQLQTAKPLLWRALGQVKSLKTFEQGLGIFRRQGQWGAADSRRAHWLRQRLKQKGHEPLLKTQFEAEKMLASDHRENFRALSLERFRTIPELKLKLVPQVNFLALYLGHFEGKAKAQ